MPGSGLRPGDPDQLGPYTLIERLGDGGFGVVFLAEGQPGDRVAVKLLQGQFAGDAAERERFAREVAAAQQVARFCTAQVLDADVSGDRPYIVSEYVAGPSLASLVAEQGPLTGGALERLAIGTATALTAIHQAGIVHRDFKPQNVLIGPDGPRVIDFGIARILDAAATASSRVVGTPSYMSPEQVAGAAIGPPTDVFAWAATLVFAASGKSPFGGDSIPAVMNRVLHQQPALEPLTGPVRELAAACLAKDPAARPPAREVLLHLLGHENHRNEPQTALLAEGVTYAASAMPGVPATAPIGRTAAVTRPDPPAAGRGRSKWLVPLAAAGAVLLVVVGSVLGYRLGQDDDSPSGPPQSGQSTSPGAKQEGKGRLEFNPRTLDFSKDHRTQTITLSAVDGTVNWEAREKYSAPLTIDPLSGTLKDGKSVKINVSPPGVATPGGHTTGIIIEIREDVEYNIEVTY